MADFISTVQDGLVGALASLDASGGGYLVQRSAFNGSSIDQIIGTLGLRTPAVVVSFLSSSIEAGPFLKRDDVTVRCNIWCADRSLRGQEASAQGSGIAGEPPGAFAIAQDVIATLWHKRLTFADRETLGIVFTGAKWIPSDGTLAVVRLDCELIIPQYTWA